MNVRSRTRNSTGSVSRELLEDGLLGRGVVVSVQQTSTTTGPDSDPAHVCVFTIEVALDTEPRFSASCRQAVRAAILPQLMLPDAVVAVRVDPDDHTRVALSPDEAPPAVTTAGSGDADVRSVVRILDEGVPCRALIVRVQALGLRSSGGDDLYAFVLTVMVKGRRPYQTHIGNPVPVEALALVYPGNTVPTKRMPDGRDYEIAIDWTAALTEVGRATA